MKNILILFILILSTNLFGQEPDNMVSNEWYYLRYNNNCNDKSIILGICHKIPENKISELLKIFEIADKLDNYCDGKDIQINKLIGAIMIKQDSCKIIYYYDDHQGMIGITYLYDIEPMLSKPYHNNSFTYYLTTKRDKYYKDLTDYNNKFKQASNDMDAILSNK
jgi:hypothetical protein